MAEEINTDEYLRINELKNFVYCPRIPFYALCLHLDRATAVSQIGIKQEQVTKQQMKRRKHALHAVHEGQRHYDVEVISHSLHLIGRIDEVIETESGIYLVDYKDTERDYGYWKIQMAAYRQGMLEAEWPVLGCYIYTIPTQTYHEVKLTAREDKKMAAIVHSLHQMIEQQVCPEPTPHSAKCQTCQYERFCNDVL